MQDGKLSKQKCTEACSVRFILGPRDTGDELIVARVTTLVSLGVGRHCQARYYGASKRASQLLRVVIHAAGGPGTGEESLTNVKPDTYLWTKRWPYGHRNHSGTKQTRFGHIP